MNKNKILSLVFLLTSFGILYGSDNVTLPQHKMFSEQDLQTFEVFLNRQFSEKEASSAVTGEFFKWFGSLLLGSSASFGMLQYFIYNGYVADIVDFFNERFPVSNRVVKNPQEFIRRCKEKEADLTMLITAAYFVFGTIVDTGIIYMLWNVFERVLGQTDVCDIKKDLIQQYLQSLGNNSKVAL